MNIEKLSTKLIKPLVPTPPNLRHYKTSFIDEFVPFINISVVVFFSPNSNHNLNFVSRLEKSLEKTLTRFYPLCGRYVDETHTVDCNDEGAEFIHAKVNIKLQDILDLDVKFVDEFIPYKIGAIDRFNDPLLATQVTVFECGGVAIGASAAHKIVDASSLSTFLSYWAAMNREEINEVDFTGPGFSSSSLFTGRCFSAVPIENISDDMSTKYIRKRFSFDESMISKMKAKAIANGNTNTRYYSKVQLVSAVLWKALMDVERATNINPRESILLQPVNLRGKMASSMPTHSYGNLWVFCPTEAGSLETSQELGYRLTDSVKKTISNYSKVYHDSEEGQTMVLNSYSQTDVIGPTKVIIVSSWCKFSFYEADFGFGKPIWAAPGCMPLENATFLMDDARGTGVVDAHILLNVKLVANFEEALEQEVKSFAA